MKIAYRLFLGFGLLILMTIVLGITALSEIQKLADITDAMYQHPLTVGYAVRDLRMDIVVLNHSMETVASANTTEQIKEAASVIENYKIQGNKNFDIVFNNFLGNMDEVKNAYRLFNEWEVMLDQVIVLHLQGNRDAAADIARGKGARQVELLMAATDKVVVFATAKADSFLSHAKTVQQRIKFTLGELLILMVIMAMVGSILISRSIVKPLGIIVERIKNLSHGNLREKVTIDSKDEMGILADSFRALQKDLLQRTGLLEQIASGNFSADIPPRSEKDDLGKSFYSMTSSLRKAKEDLATSELKYTNVTDAVPIGIAVSTPDGKIIEVNFHAMKLFGLESKKEALNYSALDYYFYPEERNRFIALLKKGPVRNFEYLAKRKDGTSFWALLSTVTEESEKHGTLFINSIVDISKRKKAEEVTIIARKEAEAANRAKSAFLSGMSHELRTPLNAILGFSQVLDGEFEGKLSKSQKGYVHTILESGKHLLSLINDILDLSKIEAGKIELFVEPLDIEEVVNNSLTMIKTRSSEQHISLKLELDELVKNTTIHADGRKLKQIMYNLLSNAVKFTPGGGSILVEASIISGNLRVSVKDSGIGINREDRDKIFQKFFQAEGGLIHKTKGTGLGLNIVKNLVELHGGKLKVQSEGKNRGTTFTFTIPLEYRGQP